MKFKIGFSAEAHKDETAGQDLRTAIHTSEPRKSVVRVHFPARNMTLAYYNDRFNLKRGDLVFVDGKLEGLRGRVVDVTYNFKIKLSDYKRVIAVADTSVTGEFHLAGSHFVTFDENALPFSKVLTWFRAPEKEDDEYVSGYDDKSFDLEHLQEMGVSPAIAERGHDYYMSNKVVYISVDEGCMGKAIVEGSEPYIVEFDYENGLVSDLTCTCFCNYPCKHQFAAMLQLKEALDLIMKHYKDQYEKSEYFAAISKGAFMNFVMDGKETGSFVMN